MPSDGDLLRSYVEQGSETAFTELVQRHVNLVHRSALRRVGGNSHAADDVTQRVFTSLARKARSLADRASLAGWLYTSARFAASDVVRAERRRRTHEEEAHTMNELNAPTTIAADQLEPLLDEVMDLLPEKDREAVLLYFFEGRSFAEVGATLAIAPDAARMRVNRTLERLRLALSQRGVTSTATALAGVLATQSAVAASTPAALAVAGQALTAAAAAGSTSVAGSLIAAAKISKVAPWIAGAVTVGLVIVAVQWFQAPLTEASDAPVLQSVELAAIDLAPPVATAETTTPSAPVAAAEPAPAGTFRSTAGLAGFAGLTNAEKNILKTLWKNQSVATAPGKRWAMSVPPDAPRFSSFQNGRDLLVAKGLVALGKPRGFACLTNAGIEFCTVHRDELGAYSPPSAPR
ncbi:MAG TPA: sigma-70 family RNA polymerase sigma factor [Opitutaceae bacterium]|nr:sigma-70 family RNA polymerase sigma factor [Opitutaceae bacterium]